MKYRIVDCLQGSEEWDELRKRPTASNFDRIVTPARGDYSKSAVEYACELVAKRIGVYTEPPPSFWMEWGTENEPLARLDYAAETDLEVRQVGFIMPEHTDLFGGSPDAIIGDVGLLEIKCPKPETLIRYHSDGVLPDQYRPQVQGLLLISQLEWCDFYAWHPELKPFKIRVMPDHEYQAKIAKAIQSLLGEIERIESCVVRQRTSQVAEDDDVEIITGE